MEGGREKEEVREETGYEDLEPEAAMLRHSTRHDASLSDREDPARRAAGVQAAINRELDKIGADARIQDLFLTRSGKYQGSTRPTNSAEQLLGHRHGVIRAALAADPSVTGIEAKTAWWWVKAHGIPIARFWARGRMEWTRSGGS